VLSIQFGGVSVIKLVDCVWYYRERKKQKNGQECQKFDKIQYGGNVNISMKNSQKNCRNNKFSYLVSRPQAFRSLSRLGLNIFDKDCSFPSGRFNHFLSSVSEVSYLDMFTDCVELLKCLNILKTVYSAWLFHLLKST